MQHSRIHRFENSIIKIPYTIYPYNIIYIYTPHQLVFSFVVLGVSYFFEQKINRFIFIFIAVLDLKLAKIPNRRVKCY